MPVACISLRNRLMKFMKMIAFIGRSHCKNHPSMALARSCQQ